MTGVGRRIGEWRERDAQRYAASRTYWDQRAGACQRAPLTASQHILHLLLTIVTCGLWAPVWMARASRGNTVQRPPQYPPPQRPY